MPTFIRSLLVHAPVATVFAFHERDDALSLLTPPFPPVRVLSRTGAIQVGARVVLRVVIFKWVALHTAYEKNRLFVDEQIEGPFASWVHRHEFSSEGNNTRLTDHVEFALPGGRIVNKLFGWAVFPGLKNMFDYRHRVTREHCERGV